MMPMASQQDAPPSGTDATLAAIYREHFPFVWRSLKALGFDASEAEDLAQDVFLVVRRRLPDFDPHRGGLRPWLYGITRRVGAQRRRSAVRAEQRLRLLPHPTAVMSPEQNTAQIEAAGVVDRFMADLDDERRAVFVLSEIEGLSGTEISAALEVNRNTVYTRLRAIRQRFETIAQIWRNEKDSHD
jgi:RNA polymerase sigma-70 factor (ECF subfamily)